MIRSILKNEIYIGTLVQGKRTTPNYKIKSRVNKKEGDWIRIPKAHQAIISEEMFRIVQNLLERDTRTSPKEDHVYLFSGMLSCGDCGEAMVRKTVKSGAKHYVYYICSGNKKDKNSCSPHRISEKSLAEVVLKSVQMYISHVLQMKNALAFIEKDSYIRANTKKQEDLVRKKKEELDKLKRRKLDLYEDLKDGILTKQEYEQLRTQYDSQLADAEQALAAMNEKLQMALQNKSEKLEWIEIFSRYQGITELNRNTIVTLIESITVCGADRVVIQYKFHKEYEALKEYIASWHDGTRNGRGTRLDRKKRMLVWKVFESYQNLMKENQIRDINTAMYESTKLLQSVGSRLRYAHIIVDEGQDFSDNAYRLLRALAGDEPANDIFIVGDSHQRIYKNHPTLSKCGINVRGRSSILKINYRTTEEIRKYAFALLNGISFDDLDEDVDLGDKCQSLTHGAVPVIENFGDASAELQFIAGEIKKLKENGVALNDICVVARTRPLIDDYVKQLKNEGMEWLFP